MSKTLHKNYEEVITYAKNVVTRKKIACKELVQACNRFFDDLENEKYDFNPRDAEFCIQIIECTFVHNKGESLDGKPLQGKHFY